MTTERELIDDMAKTIVDLNLTIQAQGLILGAVLATLVGQRLTTRARLEAQAQASAPSPEVSARLARLLPPEP